MALTVVKLERQFAVSVNGKTIKIKDPNPNLSLDEVKKFLAITYPQILNCEVGIPEIKNEIQTFTFKTAVATKG